MLTWLGKIPVQHAFQLPRQRYDGIVALSINLVQMPKQIVVVPQEGGNAVLIGEEFVDKHVCGDATNGDGKEE